MRSALLVLPLFLTAATADEGCKNTQNPPPLPRCTEKYLRDGDVKGACLTNLREICLRDGTEELFDKHGDCLLHDCPEGRDRQNIIDTFQNECNAAARLIAKIDGDFGKYLEEQDEGNDKTSTESRRDKTETESRDNKTTESRDDKTTESSKATSTTSSTEESSSTTSESSTSTDSPIPPSQPHPGPTSTTATPQNPTSTNLAQSSTASVSAPITSVTPTATKTPLPPPMAKPHDNTTLSKSQIAGVTAGGIAALAVAIGSVIFVIRRRRKRSATQSSAPLSSTGLTYMTDRFGNIHTSEWTEPHSAVGVPPPVGISEPQVGYVQRTSLRRNPDMGINF
ncbi:hypothetical protein K458DRAFT_396571 [Lentithecium fluviatile CBS 122367]|uniref:Extracellular membrane protein CFEM domain-containing protein n=1 Tax=Lentithecium fluviatile CBS 122367 TaxID=1168545 RepID=A0A6G1IF37_9PLEO|nr:hypothetical protein K458DRAFT_396571 [Lentithecium fluviatile CBS 122367]